jgi:hypothetical protein
MYVNISRVTRNYSTLVNGRIGQFCFVRKETGEREREFKSITKYVGQK